MVRISQDPWELKHYRFGLAGEGKADIIEQLLQKRRGRVLDIGCGPQGVHAVNLAKCSSLLVAVDKGLDMVRASRSDLPLSTNVGFLVANAYHLPLASESVDHVVALGMLAYVTEPERVFLEFYRVLRGSGMVMVSNSVSREKAPVVRAASASGLRLTHEARGSAQQRLAPSRGAIYACSSVSPNWPMQRTGCAGR